MISEFRTSRNIDIRSFCGAKYSTSEKILQYRNIVEINLLMFGFLVYDKIIEFTIINQIIRQKISGEIEAFF